MRENMQSSLPHVLADYNSDLIPPGTPRNIHAQRCMSYHVHEERQKTKSAQKARESPYKQQPIASVPRTATSGSRSAGKKRSKKTDEQRYEELSVKWDQAKREVRLEDHEQLLEKLALQQELIRKQDEFVEEKKKLLIQAELERKETEKQKRHLLEQELKEKCRQSLEEDRKQQREDRKRKKKAKRDGKNPSVFTSTPSPTKSPTTPPTPGTPGSSKRSFPFKMTLPAMSATPDILDSSDDEDKDTKVSADAPWHEQQLYKLYGKQADYFLRPKMEVKEKVKKTNPKLRRQGVDELFANYWKEYEQGRAGAEVLWQTLRHDSSQRLQQEDANIPKELKLPEIPKLLDHRKLYDMRKMRHKFDLMFRASKSNEDRTEVLTFNNPLPEFNHGMESVSHYLPSWQDDDSESTLPEYLRWISRKDNMRETTIPEEDGEADNTKQQKKQVTQSMDDDLIMILSRRKPQKQKQKYVFMSEKDMVTKGEFSEKYKDEKENKDIPKPYQGLMPKSYSALGGMLSASPDKSMNSSLRHSAPLPTREEMIKSYTNGWEPLSMTALVEYKKQLATVGEGDFNLGRVKMWSSIPVI